MNILNADMVSILKIYSNNNVLIHFEQNLDGSFINPDPLSHAINIDMSSLVDHLYNKNVLVVGNVYNFKFNFIDNTGVSQLKIDKILTTPSEIQCSYISAAQFIDADSLKDFVFFYNDTEYDIVNTRNSEFLNSYRG